MNPDVGQPRPETTSLRNTFKIIFVGMSGALISGDTREIPETHPQQMIQKTGESQLKKHESNIDPEAEKKLAFMRSALQQAIDYLKQDQVLRRDIPIFNDNLDGKMTCGFVDTWYKKVKPQLNEVWKYADSKSEQWNPDLEQSFRDALKVSIAAGEAINWWFVPKKYWSPTSEDQMKKLLNEKLPLPATPTSSCGDIFDMGFNYLKRNGQVPNLQSLIKLILKGNAQLLLGNMEGKSALEATEELRVAKEYLVVLDALIPKKAQ